MNRRTFLSGLAATAAGILLPASVLAEPERRVWALDRTMVQPVWPELQLSPGIHLDLPWSFGTYTYNKVPLHVELTYANGEVIKVPVSQHRDGALFFSAPRRGTLTSIDYKFLKVQA